MLSPDHDPWARGWAILWLTAALLVALTIALVPPGTLPYPPRSSTSDAALAHWPAAYFLRESVWTYHQWPLWSPLRMLGQPFAANPLNKVWYPPQWLALIFPSTLHLDLMVYGHIVLLALGVFAWTRRAGLHPLAGAFGVLAWGLSPKLVAHLGAGHLDIVYALAWAPWLLWAAESSSETPNRRSGIALGVVAAMMALADLRVAFYLLPAIGIASAVRWWGREDRDWQYGVQTGVRAGTVFLLLTAVVSVPLLTLSPHLTRGAITPQEAAAYSLPPSYLAGLVFPDLGGFQEWMTYLGLPVLALAAASLMAKERQAEKATWAGLAGLAGLWALGENGPLFLPVAQILPVVSWVRVPSRAWIVVALAVVVLATYGLDRLARYRLSRRGQLIAVGLALFGLVWGSAAWIMLPDVPTTAGAGAALLGTGIGLWLMGGGIKRLVDHRAMAGGAVLLLTLAVSLGWVAVSLVEGRTLDDITRGDEAILAAIDPPPCDPVYSPSFDLISPAAARADIPTLHGVDPFQLTWSAQTIAAAAGVRAEGYNVVAPPLPENGTETASALSDAVPDPARLAGLGVGWVVSEIPLDVSGLDLARQTESAYIYRTAGGRPVTIPVAEADAPLKPTAQVLHRACGQPPNLGLDATFDNLPGGGASSVIVVLGQAYAPGWVATVDGRRTPVRRVGGMLSGVEVPVLGEHHVRVVYRPAADLIGAAVSGLTALALTGWWLARRRRAREVQ